MNIWKEETKKLTQKDFELQREQEIISRYKRDCELNEEHIKAFTQYTTDIIGKDSAFTFECKTGLSQNMYYDIRKIKGKKNPCQKSTIVSFCVGYGLNYQIAIELLRSQGSYFNPHRNVDNAYITLLTEFRGKSVEECNRLLEKMGIKPNDRLGYHARSPKKSKK